MDNNSPTIPMPITCSTECPSGNATVNICPETTAFVVCEETLDIEAISVVAPSPVVSLIVGLAYAYVEVPLVMGSVAPFSTAPPKAALTSSKQQGQMLRPIPWPSFKWHSKSTNPQDPRPVTGIFGKPSTCQPHEDLNCCVASLVLHRTSSSDGHYLQVLPALKSFWCEFYYIGGPGGHWQYQYAYLQQCRSSHRSNYLKRMSASDVTLILKQEAQGLLSGILVEYVSNKTGGVGYFLQTYDQRYDSNGRLSPAVAFSTANIVLLPRDTTCLQNWPPPLYGIEYGGTFKYNTKRMIWFPILVNQVHLIWKSPWLPPEQGQKNGVVEMFGILI
ncbi:uncharacterized protein [Triticum aestivum]|uniref:uncharacterized protein n=1 Tax=Triticum aestivum TaxID=4565 RepID=UPI001D01299D|nr:uncharacterized protein LOC123103005 [Triticum aestivum]